MKRVGIRCQVSTFDPCLFLMLRELGVQRGRLPLILMMILGVGNPRFYPRLEIIWNSVMAN